MSARLLDPVQGRIFADWWAFCGRCGRAAVLDATTTKTAAIQAARAAGWRLNRADGWICPHCHTPDRRHWSAWRIEEADTP